MGRTKRAKTSSQPAGPKLKRPRQAKKRSGVKLSAVERCDWISTTAAALLNSASYIGSMGTYYSVKLSKAYNWTMLKGLIFTCVIKQSHSACSTHNCFVRFSPANRESLKAIVGIQKVWIQYCFDRFVSFQKSVTESNNERAVSSGSDRPMYKWVKLLAETASEVPCEEIKRSCPSVGHIPRATCTLY